MNFSFDIWASSKSQHYAFVTFSSVLCGRRGVLVIYWMSQNIKARWSPNRKSKFSLFTSISILAWASTVRSAFYHQKDSHQHPTTLYQQPHSSCKLRFKSFCCICGSLVCFSGGGIKTTSRYNREWMIPSDIQLKHDLLEVLLIANPYKLIGLTLTLTLCLAAW